jgi:hypothetical protein
MVVGVSLFVGDSGGETSTIPITTIMPEPTMRYVLPEIQIDEVFIVKAKIAQIEAEPTTKELFAKYFPKEDYNETLDVLAKVLWGECRGVYEKSITNCAAVVWCVLNRVDMGKRGHTPIQCVTARRQFTGYKKSNPIEQHLRDLAEDVMNRWLSEKEGEVDVGRVLPKSYVYFTGNGVWNKFRKENSKKKFTPKHSEVYED